MATNGNAQTAQELYQKYLDPKVLDKITSLEMKARLIVEGYMMGLNKSPFHGFSVEFKQHREYTQGDDLRYIDWKLLGRTERYYIKQYEQETNLRAHLVLDTSRSMKYKSEFASKFEYATYVAAALAYLIIQQRDSVSLTSVRKGEMKHIPGKVSMGHLKTLFYELSRLQPDGETDVATSMQYLSEKIQRRGLVIVISDLFDETEKIMQGIRFLKAKKHDVILFHLFDEYELTFPFQRLTQFEGMEEIEKLLTDPRSIREEYLKAVDRFTTLLQRECLNLQIDYVRVSTKQPLDVALSAYLARRNKILA